MDKVKFVINAQIKCIRFTEVAFALFSKRILHKMGNGNVCWISCDVVKTLTVSVPRSHSAKIISTIFLVILCGNTQKVCKVMRKQMSYILYCPCEERNFGFQ